MRTALVQVFRLAVKMSARIVVILVLMASAAYGGFRYWENRWYQGLIPAALEIEETILIDGQSGLLEGCGVAVFRLSEKNLAAIRQMGMQALSTAHEARAHPGDRYFTFRDWQPTPHPWARGGDSLGWLLGMYCVSESGTVTSIQRALAERGSYYAEAAESGLIVVPSLGLVVLSYSG